MNTITEDLEKITAGMSVSHYANDDDNFVEAVAELADLGHDREAATEALATWINETPTWDCEECGTENIEEAGWANCPNCGADNPSVVTITHRNFDGNTGDAGGLDVTDGQIVVKFDNLPGDALGCQSCGAAVIDWRHATDKETGQAANAPKVNVMRHAAFHARLGF